MASAKKPPAPEKQNLSAAKDTIQIEGVKLILETYLWRDFMPVAPPGGKPLKAVIDLLPVNKEKLPAGIDIDKFWIINNQETWSDTLKHVGQKIPSENLIKMEKMAEKGPKWQPGNFVKVIVRIKDNNSITHLLKAENQLIHRTE